MATKRRTDYQVDEEALKRMMAGDVTALEKRFLRKGNRKQKSGWAFSGETGEEKRPFQTANKEITGWSG